MRARNVISDLTINLLGQVDDPAMEGAVMTLLKRNAPEDVAKSNALTTATEGHSHSLAFGWSFGMRVCCGETSYQAGHSHPFIVDEDGDVTIGEANGHTHEVDVVAKARYAAVAKMKPKDGEDEDAYVSRFMEDKSMSDEYTDPKQRAAVAHSMFGARKRPAKKSSATQDPRENAMTAEQEKALQDQVAKANSERDAIAKRLERSERVAALTDVEKAAFKDLSGAAADSFLICSSAERAEVVAKAQSSNAEVYKALDGTVYRKSDDQKTVALAKKLDEQAGELAKSRAAREEEVLKSRVAAELPHFGGEFAAKAAILKAVDALPEAGDVRKRGVEMLRAADAALEFFAKSHGSRGDQHVAGGGDGSSGQKLVEMAKSRAAASGGKETYEKAFSSIIATPEGMALLEKAEAEKEQARRAA